MPLSPRLIIVFALLLCPPAAAQRPGAPTPLARLQAILSRYDDHIRKFDVALTGCQLDMVYFQELGSGDRRGKNWQIWRQDLAGVHLGDGVAEQGETTWRFIAPRRAGDAGLVAQAARFAALAFDAAHPVNRIDWAGVALADADMTLDYRRFSRAPLNALRVGGAVVFEAEADPARDAEVFDALRGTPAPFSVKLEAEWRTKAGETYAGPPTMFGEVTPPLRSPILTRDQAEEFGAALRDHAAEHCTAALR